MPKRKSCKKGYSRSKSTGRCVKKYKKRQTRSRVSARKSKLRKTGVIMKDLIKSIKNNNNSQTKKLRKEIKKSGYVLGSNELKRLRRKYGRKSRKSRKSRRSKRSKGKSTSRRRK